MDITRLDLFTWGRNCLWISLQRKRSQSNPLSRLFEQSFSRRMLCIHSWLLKMCESGRLDYRIGRTCDTSDVINWLVACMQGNLATIHATINLQSSWRIAYKESRQIVVSVFKLFLRTISLSQSWSAMQQVYCCVIIFSWITESMFPVRPPPHSCWGAL